MSFHYLNQHLEGFLCQTQANAYWKDVNGKYLGVNDAFLRDSGVLVNHNIVGSTDHDQAWCKDAPLMTTNDTYIMHKALNMPFIEQAVVASGEISKFLSYKSPLRNHQGKIIGIFGLSYPFKDEHFHQDQFNHILMVTGIQETEDLKFLVFKQKLQAYDLSKRQLECLYYTTKGMTAKNIAEHFSLSKRTVEHYLENIKIKLGCQSKAELISKILDNF